MIATKPRPPANGEASRGAERATISVSSSTSGNWTRTDELEAVLGDIRAAIADGTDITCYETAINRTLALSPYVVKVGDEWVSALAMTADTLREYRGDRPRKGAYR
jgi:predicted DNA-binding transcriptional regulator YafY